MSDCAKIKMSFSCNIKSGKVQMSQLFTSFERSITLNLWVKYQKSYSGKSNENLFLHL